MPHATYSLFPLTDLNSPLRTSDHRSSRQTAQTTQARSVSMPTPALALSVPWHNSRRNPPNSDFAYISGSDRSIRSVSKSSQRSYDLGGRSHSPNTSARSELSVELVGDDDGAAPPPPAVAIYRTSTRSSSSNSRSVSSFVTSNSALTCDVDLANGHSLQHRAIAGRDSSSIFGDSLHDDDSIDESRRGPGTEYTAPTSASIHTLPPLQARGLPSTFGDLDPVAEDDPTNYDLVEPVVAADKEAPTYSLEQRAEDMFSRHHLQAIFEDPALLLRFTSYLGTYRQASVPVLIYYLDATKALKAIKYANSVSKLLRSIDQYDFTKSVSADIQNEELQKKADMAFETLQNHDLPAFVTHVFTNVVSVSIQQRITGRLPPHLREASEGLAEVFCLSDPSRRDNPIVFASEEFHRTTQYGVGYAIGRNCRFLQGPRTNPYSVERLAEAIKAGRDHCETFINYRRDGSPFLNMLMVAPLRDSRGKLRYFIGAQVDVSGLAKECTGLEGLQRLIETNQDGHDDNKDDGKDDFRDLAEMFNLTELDVVKQFGGRMHRQHLEHGEAQQSSWHQPRLMLADDNLTPPDEKTFDQPARTVHGRLVGVYSHYLLIRPYPSLRILFTSPSLRVPGTLQSPFMDRIGSSERVREELLAALAAGRGVTAKVRWLAGAHDEVGRNRWLHCTPLLGGNGNVGVWMAVLVDDQGSAPRTTKYKEAPPVPTNLPRHHDPDLHERKGPMKIPAQAKKASVETERSTSGAIEEHYSDFGKPSIVSRR